MKLNRLMGFTPNKERETIATGFEELDYHTGGLPIGKICTIAARPGMGSTILAISLLRNIGVINKVPSAFLSLNMSEFEIVERIKVSLLGKWDFSPYHPYASVVSQMDPAIISMLKSKGVIHKDTFNKEVISQMMKEAPIWIEHDTGIAIDELIRRIERLHQENNVRIVFIDSLEWFYFSSNFEQKQFYLKLKEAAEKFNVAVVLTSKIDKSCERNLYFRPFLKDINNLESIFSSIVLFIYRPEYYKLDTFEDNTPSEGLADVMIVKHHYGACGAVRLRFLNFATFVEISYFNASRFSIENPMNKFIH